MFSVPRKPRGEPGDQADEAPGLIDQDQVDVERDAPLGENEPVEREPRETPERPSFEE
ncbi:hypothetical protein I6F35_28960 [Bradyrhizobium sp. BRP22]|uniref:hypothetical protein n=1 Tax=Bradyrhizobium sp. BRP22 TaxID=2793821 RepID=UPI001CD5E560|nr:hypothetical protein [Bradyrhizobium sp. BRP22]MCA1457191.1 hypothetical protein [Bradyrhizobium sp. BRP22]